MPVFSALCLLYVILFIFLVFLFCNLHDALFYCLMQKYVHVRENIIGSVLHSSDT